MDEDTYILIDQYLAGELNPEEKKAFEDRMKNDPDFSEKVLVYSSLTENLQSRFSGNQEEKRLRDSLQAISKVEITEKSAKVIPLNWYLWAAAASIALFAVVWFYIDKPGLPEYSQYAFHGSLSLAERGSDSLQQQAEKAFNAADYTRAIHHLNKLLEVDPNNTEVQLYKGVSLLELGETKEAESIFQAIKNSDTVYKDKAIWYLALSALKQKDYDKCKALLEQLPLDSEDHDKAKEILKKLP